MLLAQLLVAPALAQQTLFTPEAGLSGATRGEGTLTMHLWRTRPFRVRSFGARGENGLFNLNQTIIFSREPPMERAWVIRTVAPGRYAGTLTDAAGAVSGHTSGRRLFLRYRVMGPLVMHQVLHLQPDGKTIDNVGRITMLGITVGTLRETIRRDD